MEPSRTGNSLLSADFLDSHRRHLKDAERLYGAQRWANADHLYGLAAECGLKRLMLAFGMQVDGAGRPVERDDRVHVNDSRRADNAWVRFEVYRCGFGQAGFVLGPSPFGDWDVDQRYAHQNDFNVASVDPHRLGADQVHALVGRAELSGLL